MLRNRSCHSSTGGARKILSLIQQARGGKMYDSTFGKRMTGEGPYAEMLKRRYHVACARLGLNRERIALDASRFRPPVPAGPQRSLFESR